MNILYEDNHLVVVNKAAGRLVQGDRTGDPTLADEIRQYLKKKYNKPGDVFLGIVHRLDRPVSGAVVLARTSKGLERMNKLLRERQVRKVYWAITKNKPDELEGELVHWLRKDVNHNKTSAYNKEEKRTKKAVLSYKLAGKVGGFYLLEVSPETGRPHQIRVQLAKIGCPIFGDIKYGGESVSNRSAIYLHSRTVTFIHPIKKTPLRVIATLPKDQIWSLFSGVEVIS